MFLRHTAVLFTIGLCLFTTVSCQAEEPRIVVSPSFQCANQTSFLSLTCIAYVGQEATYQPTAITWYNGANEQITNNSQVTIYSRVVVIEGLVFIESTLEARTVYSHLTGQSSCMVSNARGQDRASWTIVYDIEPPVTITLKPASQAVNYTSTVRMTCLVLVGREEANDTTVTWWGEFGQITTNNETAIYSSRIWLGSLLFIESLLEVCSANYQHIGALSCIAENSLGRDIANWTATPPVRYPPPSLTISSSSVLLSYGQMVNVSCTVNAGPRGAYSIDPAEITWWDTNGRQIAPIAGQVNIYTTTTFGTDVFVTSTLEINSIGPQHVGGIQCAVGSTFGTDAVTFTVETYEILASPQLLVTPPLNQTVDCRSRVTLTCIVNAFPIPGIQWSFNGDYVDNGASDNVNINHHYVNRIGLNFTETYLDICDFNGENVGYYSCSVWNILGNYTSNPVWIGIDLQTAPPVLPPTQITADRTSNGEAMVNFEPQSPGTFDVAYYIANDSTTPYLTNRIDSVQVTFQRPQVTITDLNTCYRYWVVITGNYCSRSSSTEPMLIELFNLNPYELTLTLDGKDGSCDAWITKDPETKAKDMEVGLRMPASDCGFDIPCFEGSMWKCTDGDPTKVTFKTQLVGHSSETAGQIKKCIDEWIMSAKATGQTFALGSSNLTATNFVEESGVGDALPIWVWIVVAVGGTLLVVCFVTVIIVAALVSKRKSGLPISKKERIIDNNYEVEDDEAQAAGDYTVAVVDNPLYAENEGDIDAYMKEELGDGEEELEIQDEDLKKSDI